MIDLNAVYRLAADHASFDATPTFADIQGLYERNPEYFYVAEDSGEIVGFITGYERKGIPETVLRTWKATKAGYVDLMAVDPAHRRGGIGTSLMNTLLEHFRKDGIDLVILDVPADQMAAVKLYEKRDSMFELSTCGSILRMAPGVSKTAGGGSLKS